MFRGKTSTSDLVTVVGIVGAEFRLIGMTVIRLGSSAPYGAGGEVSELASVGLVPKGTSVRRIGDGMVS